MPCPREPRGAHPLSAGNFLPTLRPDPRHRRCRPRVKQRAAPAGPAAGAEGRGARPPPEKQADTDEATKSSRNKLNPANKAKRGSVTLRHGGSGRGGGPARYLDAALGSRLRHLSRRSSAQPSGRPGTSGALPTSRSPAGPSGGSCGRHRGPRSCPGSPPRRRAPGGARKLPPPRRAWPCARVCGTARV